MQSVFLPDFDMCLLESATSLSGIFIYLFFFKFSLPHYSPALCCNFHLSRKTCEYTALFHPNGVLTSW